MLSQCLENAVKKETELPKLINEVIKEMTGKEIFSFGDSPSKQMRSAEEILKDYGLGGMVS